jgi:ABC-type antimicrobial peptide transport system, permease component
MDVDTWEEILVTITRNKTRSLLTAFGVFWGIFMLIALIGGGNGMKEMMQSNFDGFATNSAFFIAEQTGEPYKGFRKGRWWSLDYDDVRRIKRTVPEVEVITPVISRWGQTAVYNEKKSNCQVKGLEPEYAFIEKPLISFGRYLNEVDVRESRKVCVLGKRVYEELFTPGEDPCGKYVKIDGVYYQVIGVNIAESNMSINGRASEAITLPITTMQRTYNFGKRVHLISFTARPGYKITDVQNKVETVVKQAHLISPTDKQAVFMLNAEAMFSMVDNLFKGINILIWMVGLGTLLAGAIGVSNIMMVTVRERTTELGIRRAIGARPKDILQQILSESIVLTSIAGMAGITFAVFILQLAEMGINSNPGRSSYYNFQVSFGMAIGTAIILLTLGMLAGLAPAYRAMAVKPIDAIRDE